MEKRKDWILTQGWVVLLEFALVAALAVALAHWTWVALTPRTFAVPGTLAELEVQRPGAIVERHLFGVSRQAAAGGAGVSGSALRLKVLGVFARGEPGAGRAIVALDNGRPATVTAGEGIAAGIVLHEVHPDHVLVLRGGVIERIDLERSAAALEAKPGAPRPASK